MRMECVRTELPQTKLDGVTSTSVLWAFRRKYVSRIQSINSTQNQYCIFKTKADPSVGMVILDSVNRDCARNNLHCTPIFLIRVIWRYRALLLRDKVKLLKKSSNPPKTALRGFVVHYAIFTVHLLSLWWMLCCPHSPPPLLSPLLQIKRGTYW